VGDHEEWNNEPAHEAPKPVKTPYSEDKKHASRVTLWIDAGVAILIALGIIWYVFYR